MADRRAHQCHRDGCTSQAEFAVDVHLICRAPNVARSVSMHSTIQCCDKHKDDVRGYILSEQNKENIRTALMESGLPEPDFFSVRLEFKPIEAEPIIVVVPCDREGCANPAKWRIKQIIPEIGRRGKPRLEAMTNLCVCDKHKKLTKPADFLDDESRAQTWAWLNEKGVLLPDLEHMTLEFVPLTAENHGTFQINGAGISEVAK